MKKQTIGWAQQSKPANGFNMNPPVHNAAPRWTAYLKTCAQVVPATAVWIFACVFVVPKLKEICAATNMDLAAPIITALTVSDFVRTNFILLSVVILTALILLEWRSRQWPHYRRRVLGLLGYLLNLVVLAIMTALCVLAVVAGANLLHAK